jgi:hypothetical protein
MPTNKPSESATSPSGSELGITPVWQNALELIGRSDQEGLDIVYYGYLTGLHGLTPKELFLETATHTEATARFTFFGKAAIDSRHAVGNIITTAAPGEFAIYLNDRPGGDFKDPRSFARSSAAVATYQTRYHCVLAEDLSDPNVGPISAGVDLTQVSAVPFPCGDGHATIGREGSRLRGAMTGQGWLTGRDPFRAWFLFGGHFVVLG